MRLSGSLTPHAGRVQIGIHGIWGTINHAYHHSFPSESQRVICRQLGFNDSILGTVWMQNGPTIRPQWFYTSEIRCLGNETNIRDCISSTQPQLRRNYYYAQDIGVVCKPKVPQINGEF